MTRLSFSLLLLFSLDLLRAAASAISHFLYLLFLPLPLIPCLYRIIWRNSAYDALERGPLMTHAKWSELEKGGCGSYSPLSLSALCPFSFCSTCAVGAGATGVQEGLLREAGQKDNLLEEDHVVASYSDLWAFKVEWYDRRWNINGQPVWSRVHGPVLNGFHR